MDSTKLGSWQADDTMSRWRDGSSNQLIVGEKYIPQSYVNICEYDGVADNRGKLADCSLLLVGSLNNYASMRTFRGGMGKEPDNTGNIVSDKQATPKPTHWGGIHPGVGNFLIGDGSVRSLINTIPTGDKSLLHYLGDVRDGNSVSLP
jgi:hypothetical protein